MPKCVVLLSGGLDSATVLAIAKNLGFECYALTVEYGQRHVAELRAAAMVANELGASQHRQVHVGLDSFGGSALTSDIDVPKNRAPADSAEIPITYVPARNTVMLSLALAYAEVIEAFDIFIGVNSVDYSGYPDCRPEFIAAFEHMAAFATKAGVEGRGIRIHAPLIALTKEQIIQQGLKLGVEYGLTHSCYDPALDGTACGECDACLIRSKAFGSIGLSDPALAQKND